jgi:hypothetical protein
MDSESDWNKGETENRRKSSSGMIVSLCTCLICLLVVIMLMMAVLLLHDKEEAQGYDYPMYQVFYTECGLNKYSNCRRISCLPTIRREGVEVMDLDVLRKIW